jgi:hypothetical protein
MIYDASSFLTNMHISCNLPEYPSIWQYNTSDENKKKGINKEVHGIEHLRSRIDNYQFQLV